MAVYKNLFDGSIDEYSTIAKQYVKYWALASGGSSAINCCFLCRLCYDLPEKELFHLYYSTMPLTAGVLVDAAVVLISCFNNEPDFNTLDLIMSLDPLMIAYHLFFNCCFINSENDTNTADLMYEITRSYLIYNTINFKEVSYKLNMISPKESKCKGDCGQLKQIINKMQTNKKSDTVIFAGEEKSISVGDQINLIKYADSRLVQSHKLVFDLALNVDGGGDGDDKDLNIFERFHWCKICTNMMLCENYIALEEWEKKFCNNKNGLKGGNVATCVFKTNQQLPLLLQNNVGEINVEKLVNHKQNMFCVCNTRRFVKFFDVFTDIKKLSDPICVKHTTDTFLNTRNNLICCEMHFFIWLEQIMCNEMKVYNDKIAGCINKTFLAHQENKKIK